MTDSRFKPETLHPDYVEFLPEWDRIDDAAGGETVVKARNNGKAYLTPTMGMSVGEFKLYVHLARFLPAIGKTLVAYNGLIHRKVGVLSNHEQVSQELLTKLLENFSRKGQSIEDFAEELTANYSKFKRGGVLTEYSSPVILKNLKILADFHTHGSSKPVRLLIGDQQ